jgi:hypothetical protein
LRSNPAHWARTLLIITYDEHGGLYDHVILPIADVLSSGRPDVLADPTGTSGLSDGGGTVGGHGGVVVGGATTTTSPGRLAGLHTVAVTSPGLSGGGASTGGSSGPATAHGLLGGFHRSPEALSVVLGDVLVAEPVQVDATLDIHYGVRVPTFVVSPWVTPGKGPDVVLDHCSIIKTVLARFCGDDKPFLSDRIRASHSFEDYLNAAQPLPDPGPSPVLQDLPITARRLVSGASQIVTPALYRKRMRNERVDFHDISGRLARMLGR